MDPSWVWNNPLELLQFLTMGCSSSCGGTCLWMLLHTHNSWVRQITRGIWVAPQMASCFLSYFLHMANRCYYINVVLLSYVYIHTPNVSRFPNCLANIFLHRGRNQSLRNVPNKIKLSTKKQQRGRLEQKPRVYWVGWILLDTRHTFSPTQFQ